MTLKPRFRHQRVAAVEAVQRIGPEIVDGILVGMLDEAPQCPQKIAHGLVDDDPPTFGRTWLAAEIGADHLLLLRWRKLALDREIAKVPHGIVHPRIFPIDDPHALSRIEEIL